MAQELTLLPAGWIPDPNPHSAAPPGAATIADNVVIERRGVVQSRPGFPTSAFAGTAARVGTYIIPFEGDEYLWETVGATYSCTVLTRVSDGSAVLKHSSTGPGNDLSVSVGSSASAETRSNLYFTTSDGLRRIENPAGMGGIEADLAGVPAGLTPITTLKVAATHWFKADSQVAYRIVFQKTVGGIPLYGAPSGYALVTNPALGAVGLVELDIAIPLSTTGARGGLGVIAGDRLLVYRTTSTDLAITPPGDEMQLAADIELTGTDIAAGRYFMADYVINDNLGAFLYTNSTIDGILQANSRPPVSSEVVAYASSLYFGNCEVPAQQTVDIVRPDTMVSVVLTSAELTAASATIVNFGAVSEDHVGMFLGAVRNAGVGAWSGDPLNGGTYLDKFTQIIAADIVARTYTISAPAKVSTVIGANSPIEAHSFVMIASQGQIDDSLAPPFQKDIYFSNSPQNAASVVKQIFTVDATSASLTAQSLSAISSQNQSRYFNITSVGNEKVASIVFEDRTPRYAAPSDASECELYGFSENSFAPSLPVIVPDPFLLGTGYTFQTNLYINRVYYSKQSQPEAVPKTNYFDVGSSSHPIQRMVRTRESLFIIKEDGVFRLTATSAFDQRLDLVDPTYALVHPDACCSFDNRMFAWTNQGVVLISDSGIVPISANVIQTELETIQHIIRALSPNCKPFAFADESRDLVYLGVPSIVGAFAYCTEMFVFCGRTQTWSKYSFTDRHLRDGTKARTEIYAQLAGSTTAPQSQIYSQVDSFYDASYGITITAVTATEVDIAAASGWTPVVGDTIASGGAALVVVFVTSAVKFSVHDVGAVLGAATSYVGFKSEIEFIVKEAQNPGRLKHWRYVVPIFEELTGMVTFDATFRTNQDTTPATLNAVVPYTLVANPRTVRLTPTRPHSRAAELFVRFGFRTALANWKFQGMSLTYNAGSSRVQR